MRDLLHGFLATVSALTLLPLQAAAQDEEEAANDCSFERRHQIECLQRRAEQSAEAYDLTPLSDFDGEQFRIFFLDDWDMERRAIIVSRPRGGSPRMEVHFPRNGRDPISETVSGEAWYHIVGRSELFMRSLSPPPPREDGTLTICLHPPTAIVEHRKGDGSVARSRGNACLNSPGAEGFLAYEFADRTHRYIAETLVRCSDLSRDYIPSTWRALEYCSYLEGDTASSSAVLNAFARFDLEESETASPERILARNAVLLRHDGTSIEGRDAIATYWRNASWGIFPHRVVGIDAENVRMHASIDLLNAENVDGSELWIDEATFTFGRQDNRRLVITHIELGEPVPVTYSAEDD